MAESMKGLHRTHRCTEVSSKNIGETVTVMGWVQKRRNLGSLIFIDLRDRSGLLQLIFDENDIGSQDFAKAGELRSEYVIRPRFNRFLYKKGGTNTHKHFLLCIVNASL